MNKRLLTVFAVGFLGLGACAPAADESMSEASDFVPPRDTDVLIAELTFSSQGVPYLSRICTYHRWEGKGVAEAPGWGGGRRPF